MKVKEIKSVNEIIDAMMIVVLIATIIGTKYSALSLVVGIVSVVVLAALAIGVNIYAATEKE